jgi:hypothetical protein
MSRTFEVYTAVKIHIEVFCYDKYPEGGGSTNFTICIPCGCDTATSLNYSAAFIRSVALVGRHRLSTRVYFALFKCKFTHNNGLIDNDNHK